MVLDKNFATIPEVYSFLKNGNTVVLTDAFMIETFKGNPDIKVLQKAFSQLKRIPTRVEIMKLTKEINSIRNLSTSKLQHRLIDQKQTSAFETFCEVLFSDRSEKDISNLLSLSELKSFSDSYMDSTKTNSLDMVLESMKYYQTQFSKLDLAHFINEGKTTSDFLNKVIKHVMLLSANMMNKNGMKIMELSRAINTYSFRFSLSCTILVMKWILDSGYESTKREKLNNDIIDMTYIANSTFFEGILTNDKKAILLRKRIIELLSVLG